MPTRVALVEGDADEIERRQERIEEKLSKIYGAIWLLVASIIGGVVTTLLVAAAIGRGS